MTPKDHHDIKLNHGDSLSKALGVKEIITITKTKEGADVDIKVDYNIKSKHEEVALTQHEEESAIQKHMPGLKPGEKGIISIIGKSYIEDANQLGQSTQSVEPEEVENGYHHRAVLITNKLGMHARPASSFVIEARKYFSEIYVHNSSLKDYGDISINGKNYVDGKSIMSLMTLAASKGTKLEIITKGQDARQALCSLEQLVKSGFGEE